MKFSGGYKGKINFIAFDYSLFTRVKEDYLEGPLKLVRPFIWFKLLLGAYKLYM